MNIKIVLVLSIVSTITMRAYECQGQSIDVDNTSYTVEELVNEFLLGEGVEATNITFNGMAANLVSVQTGLFSGTSNVIPFDSAIVMVSGDASQIVGGFGSLFDNFEDDPDLMDISNQSINDAAIIEFDFIANSDSIRFNYVFASNEYPSYTCTNFNDAFGFFLSGGAITGPFTNNAINIALIPDTDIPVAINTVNSGMPTGGGSTANCDEANPNWVEDSIYFVPNDNQPGNDVQFPGMTVSLTAVADVDCGETYHIKLAIGDALDGALDSGVFLQAGSFSAFGEVIVDLAPNIGGSASVNPLYDSVLVAGCSDAIIQLIRPGGLPIDSIFVEFSGTANLNEDYLLGENDTLFFFPDGVDTLLFSVTTLWDEIPNENEELIVTIFFSNGCGEVDSSSASLFFVDPYSLSSETEDLEIICPTDQVTVTAEGLDGIEPYFYDWGDFGDSQDVTVSVPDEQEYYLVAITDICDFETIFDSVLVVNSIPDSLQMDIDPFVQPDCPNSPVDLSTTILNGNPPYAIIWSDALNRPYLPNSAITVINTNQVVQSYREELPVFLTVIDSCGSMAKDTVSLNYPFFEPLTAEFGPLTDNCPKAPVALEARTTGGAGELEYLWAFEGGQEASFPAGSGPFTQNTLINAAGGVNVYTLSVTDRCRRANADMISTTDGGNLDYTGDALVEDSLRVIKFIPAQNVMTPNGDSKNDFLVIDGVQAFSDARLEVYDRWGKLVFETDNYSAGSASVKPADAFEAKDLQDGTYFYVINVDSGECINSETIQVLGSND